MLKTILNLSYNSIFVVFIFYFAATATARGGFNGQILAIMICGAIMLICETLYAILNTKYQNAKDDQILLLQKEIAIHEKVHHINNEIYSDSCQSDRSCVDLYLETENILKEINELSEMTDGQKLSTESNSLGHIPEDDATVNENEEELIHSHQQD